MSLLHKIFGQECMKDYERRAFLDEFNEIRQERRALLDEFYKIRQDQDKINRKMQQLELEMEDFRNLARKIYEAQHQMRFGK